MKFTEQTSLDLHQNSLKEKKFMKWNQFWNIEGEDEDINTFWNGKDIQLPRQHGKLNQHSLTMATCWLPTRNTINSDNDQDCLCYLFKQDESWTTTSFGISHLMTVSDWEFHPHPDYPLVDACWVFQYHNWMVQQICWHCHFLSSVCYKHGTEFFAG